MSLTKNLCLSLALVPALSAFLAIPAAPAAAKHAQHVKCEITKDGKTETKDVKSADECTKEGGKVVKPEKKAKTAAPAPKTN